MQLPSIPVNNNFRVLVVEDDPSIARLVLTHTQKAGFQGQLATSGESGWQSFKEFQPHIVLLDGVLPGLNGWDLAAKIREHSLIPILIITAVNTENEQIKGFKMGADDYIIKPFQISVLMARIVAHLRRAYRYSVPAAPVQTAAPVVRPQPAATAQQSTIPEGWSQCEECGYLGPQFKFQALDSNNYPIFKCPNCKATSLTYSIG